VKDDEFIAEIPEFRNITMYGICIGARSYSTIWITNNNELYVHGRNDTQKLGIDHKKNIQTPIIVDNIVLNKNARIISADTGQYISMILCTDGSVWSTGYSGWYAHGHSEAHLHKFTKINFSVKMRKVSIGSGMTMFLDQNGHVWGCGYNATGVLGLSHDNSVETPVKNQWFIDDGIFITDLEMGEYHAILLDNTGRIYCCGDNTSGQCAVDINIKNDKVLTPIRVGYDLEHRKIKQIRIGGSHTGCITEDDEYYLWGTNASCRCCIEDESISAIFKPNNVTEYVCTKSDCNEILDMVLCRRTTLFLLR